MSPGDDKMTSITAEPFGLTRSGEAVTRYELRNSAGMRVRILSYGCTVQSILVPDAAGKLRDVALGYDDLASYEAGNCFFGAVVGRYANRIKGAAFSLDGRDYTLPKNDGNNHLHGVMAHQVFSGSVEGDVLVLRRTSPDGEEGFPGTLQVSVRYHLGEDNALSITYDAQTDAATVINLTNHTYFNLNGQDGSDVLDHVLALHAEAFTECDAQLIPTGRILPVAGTPMDFRSGRRIGVEIDAPYPQLQNGSGYDHNYVLKAEEGALLPFAEVCSAQSGIKLNCFTTQAGVQFYTGNYLHQDTAPAGKGGKRYPRRGGFCLETQHYPASPNFPQFPSTRLNPGERYHQETVYQFSIEA